MLRWMVAVVLLLNLGFYAWSHLWLAPLGLVPVPPGEPERLQQQVRPERMVLRKDIAANLPPALGASQAPLQTTSQAGTPRSP